MTANGIGFATARTFKSWPGYVIRVVAPTTAQLKRFCGWADGPKYNDRTFETLRYDAPYFAVYKLVC